jgi:hypothetical protein
MLLTPPSIMVTGSSKISIENECLNMYKTKTKEGFDNSWKMESAVVFI